METLSLLIPIYNEQGNLAPLIDVLSKVNWPVPVELVFVDDCSKDNSHAELRRCLEFFATRLSEKKVNFQIHRHEINRGKGAAIHTAISKATGTILMVQDADSEYDPFEIPTLLQPILDGRAEAVFGSRFFKNPGQTHRTYHYLINRILTVISNLLSGLYLTDMETCYKVFRREILTNIILKSERFGFEPEVTAHLARLKVRVWEMPITYYPRSYMEGKKITWKDGIAAFWHLIYFNWFVRLDNRFRPELPRKYRFSKWSERYTGHAGHSPQNVTT